MKRSRYIKPGRSKGPVLSVAVIFSFLFAFFSLFPNPALPVGSNTGLQAGQIVALLSMPVLLVLGLPRKHTLVLVLLLLPLLLSGFLVVLTGHALSTLVVLNSTIALALVFVVLVPVGSILNMGHTVALLSGVAWAIGLHALIGLYQAYKFARDEFPLPGLYQNPSFGGFIAKDPENWATYVKRPFGLFPEPSAMTASIGPWLVLIVGLLLYPKLGPRMTRGTRAQLLLAAVSGMVLILISSSGFTVWLLISLLLVVLPILKNRFLRLHRPGSLLALVALVLIGVVLVEVSLYYVGSRLDIQGNSSWSARLASIIWGLAYLGTSASTLLYGVGPGQSFLMLQDVGSSNLLPESPGEIAVTAVWSGVVHYIQETGLVGTLALTLALFVVLRAIVRSSARILGFSSLLAWLAGVVFTTSYLTLLPIWLFFGVLLGWDLIFKDRTTAHGLDPELRSSFVGEAVKT